MKELATILVILLSEPLSIIPYVVFIYIDPLFLQMDVCLLVCININRWVNGF